MEVKDDNDQPYIDETNKAIKCSCMVQGFSRERKHVNQHIKISVSHCGARKDHLKQSGGQRSITDRHQLIMLA